MTATTMTMRPDTADQADRSGASGQGWAAVAAKLSQLQAVVDALDARVNVMFELVGHRQAQDAKAGQEPGASVPAPVEWTPREALALRLALRMSIEQFAERLGVATRTVARWQRPEENLALRSQELLDTALAMASPAVQARFAALLLAQTGEPSDLADESADRS